MSGGSGLGYIQKHILYRLRLTWYRVTRPGAVTKGNPYRQIWVDPNAISTSLPSNSLKQEDHFAPLRSGRFCKYRGIGMVEDGDWDTQVRPNAPRNGLLFKALEDRYHNRKSWQETDFFASVVEKVEKGARPWNGCRNHDDILNRCERADRLIESIKRDGFKENAHPVVICIGRQGELIKSGNGQHRIMLGLITGSKIPVLPVVRHKKWEDIRTGRGEDRKAFETHPDIAP